MDMSQRIFLSLRRWIRSMAATKRSHCARRSSCNRIIDLQLQSDGGLIGIFNSADEQGYDHTFHLTADGMLDHNFTGIDLGAPDTNVQGSLEHLAQTSSGAIYVLGYNRYYDPTPY